MNGLHTEHKLQHEGRSPEKGMQSETSAYNSPPRYGSSLLTHDSPSQMQQATPPYGSSYGSPSFMDTIPAGVDRDAFIAGERAAMNRSLQMMLPSQQQLGMLGSGLQRVEYMISEESNRLRQMQHSNVEITTIAQNLSERLDAIERSHLPEIERRVQHAIDAPLSQEFQATLLSLSSAMQANSRAQYIAHEPSTLTGFMIRQLSYLGSAAMLYAQKALSKADIAALFLSRKILLDDKVHVSGSERSSVDGSVNTEPLLEESTGLDSKVKSVSGAALFLVAVEAAWQLHARVLRLVPRPLQRFTSPAQVGLKLLRIAAWVASFLLSAVLARRGCHWIADSSISQFMRLLAWCTSFKSLFLSKSQVTAPKGDDESQGREAGIQGPEAGGSSRKSEDKLRWPQNDVIRLQVDAQHGNSESEAVPLHRVRSIFDTPPPSP